MFLRLATLLLVLITPHMLVSRAYSSDIDDTEDGLASRKYKFLYLPSFIGGSHYATLSRSADALVRRGHRVVFLRSSSDAESVKREADLFSVVLVNSSYTEQDRARLMADLFETALEGKLRTFWGPLVQLFQGRLVDIFPWISGDRECNNLLGDSGTMKRLRDEGFDLLIGDEDNNCSPLLAQALHIPFILNCVSFASPAYHRQTGLPMDPSYMPERNFRLTDKMTFIERVQNVIFYVLHGFMNRLSYTVADELKIKYNIKPEISTYESKKQAKLYLFQGSFGLEFPRPMQPNTAYVLPLVEVSANQTIEEDVATFLDTAPTGVVLFSLGSYARMQPKQAQLFADGFAMLPHRVLWQANGDLSEVKMGNNTKIVQWLPMRKVMEHVNIKVYVSHGGAPSMYEAMWVGLPMVGLPLVADQMDDLVRIVDRGIGLSLDISTVTPETLRQAISTVMTEPRFTQNAQRVSRIIRDLQTSSPPVETVVHWILHIAKFGGDHLRPAVQDLNFLQRNLIDVYSFLFALSVITIWAITSVCTFCCKCMYKGTERQVKED